VLAAALSPPGGVVAVPGLAPKDDVRPVADALARESGPLMLVGHLPFLGRLAALLICGDLAASAVRFRNGGIVTLTRQENQWMVSWVLTPEMASGN
jgi:phosphohistidine phosphatase